MAHVAHIKFHEALAALELGHWLRRIIWQDQQVARTRATRVSKIPILALYDPITDRWTRAWCPTPDDLFAADWEIVRHGD